MSGRLAAIVPALLFAVAILASLAAAFWFVAAVWLPVGLVVLSLRHLLLSQGKRKIWLGVLFAAVVACPILVFEGGFFVLPAALALLIVDARRANGGRLLPSGS
jgi:hypothetical protein